VPTQVAAAMTGYPGPFPGPESKKEDDESNIVVNNNIEMPCTTQNSDLSDAVIQKIISNLIEALEKKDGNHSKGKGKDKS